jgi:hypothetical protein
VTWIGMRNQILRTNTNDHEQRLRWQQGTRPLPNHPNPEVKRRSISFWALLAAGLVVFIQMFSLPSPVLLRFLPSITDADLDRLSRKALHEKVSDDK